MTGSGPRTKATIVCPVCGHPVSEVVDSRSNHKGVRRRRRCLACYERFSTLEMIVKIDDQERAEKLWTEAIDELLLKEGR